VNIPSTLGATSTMLKWSLPTATFFCEYSDKLKYYFLLICQCPTMQDIFFCFRLAEPPWRLYTSSRGARHQIRQQQVIVRGLETNEVMAWDGAQRPWYQIESYAPLPTLL
jgi:hypothetical protein